MHKGPHLSCTIFRTILGEATNRAQQNPAVVNLLSQQALSIRYSTPSRTLPDAVTPIVRLKAQNLAGLGNGAAVSSWSDTATGDSFNGTVSQSTAANRPTLSDECAERPCRRLVRR